MSKKKKNKFNQDSVDSRLTLNDEIEKLLGAAYEDYQMQGLYYVRSEVTRHVKSFKKEFRTGKII